DGKWLAFVRADDVYVTAFPSSGSDAIEIGFETDPIPVYRLSTEGGGYIGWADGGKVVVWGRGDTIFRQSLETVRAAIRKAPDAKRKVEAAGGGSEGGEKAEKKEPEIPKPSAIPVDLTVKKPRPSGSVVLTHARVITLKGDEVLDRADIVVTGNRIAAIGPSGE